MGRNTFTLVLVFTSGAKTVFTHRCYSATGTLAAQLSLLSEAMAKYSALQEKEGQTETLRLFLRKKEEEGVRLVM